MGDEREMGPAKAPAHEASTPRAAPRRASPADGPQSLMPIVRQAALGQGPAEARGPTPRAVRRAARPTGIVRRAVRGSADAAREWLTEVVATLEQMEAQLGAGHTDAQQDGGTLATQLAQLRSIVAAGDEDTVRAAARQVRDELAGSGLPSESGLVVDAAGAASTDRAPSVQRQMDATLIIAGLVGLGTAAMLVWSCLRGPAGGAAGGGAGAVPAGAAPFAVPAGWALGNVLPAINGGQWAGQATYLSAVFTPVAGPPICGLFASGGGLHAEDHLLASLPAVPGTVLININRSPCTSSDHGAGALVTPSSTKAIGCAQDLIARQGGGLQIQIICAHAYGSNSKERASSILAARAMSAAGIHVDCDPGFFDVGAMKIVSVFDQ